MDEPIGSVVIPAHDEALVLASCLRALEPALGEGRLEVVVVSNGSHDDTVETAERALARVGSAQVLNIPEASKMAALRAGDRAATLYPRLYLDADITVDGAAVEDLLARLAAVDEPRVAAPRLRMDTVGCAWAVQSYHRVWKQLPYVTGGVIGTGAYAVNRSGGERLGEFPDLLNDDEWVRRRFELHERIITEGEFVARAPRNVMALIRQRARTMLGNDDLTGAVAAERDTSPRDLIGIARRGVRPFLDVVVYAGVTLAAQTVAARRRRTGRSGTWSTDTTSRKARAEGSVGMP